MSLLLMISNQRPETHHFNSVTMYAVETPDDTPVYLDTENRFWPAVDPAPPVYATDHSSRDITKLVSSRDARFWEFDLARTSVLSDFEDVIDLTFERHAVQNDGSLLFHGINTNFSAVLFNNLGEFLGDQSLRFLQAIENDPELISTLKTWTRDVSLKAYIWNGREWEHIGEMLPEANVADFSRLIRFTIADSGSEEVRIRLRALADVWQIDAAQVDWSAEQPLEAAALEMISAADSDGRNVEEELSLADELYVTLMPPEHMELHFRAPSPAPGRRMSYAAAVQGYLYEWLPGGADRSAVAEKIWGESEKPFDDNESLAGSESASGKTSVPRPTSSFGMPDIPGEQKIAFLKALLGNRALLLPPLYAEWKRVKGEDAIRN